MNNARQRRAFLGVSFRSGALAAAQTAAAHTLAGATPEETARREDYWRQIRLAFALDPNIINLNSGNISAAPRHVQDMMNRYV